MHALKALMDAVPASPIWVTLNSKPKRNTLEKSKNPILQNSNHPKRFLIFAETF